MLFSSLIGKLYRAYSLGIVSYIYIWSMQANLSSYAEAKNNMSLYPWVQPGYSFKGLLLLFLLLLLLLLLLFLLLFLLYFFFFLILFLLLPPLSSPLSSPVLLLLFQTEWSKPHSINHSPQATADWKHSLSSNPAGLHSFLLFPLPISSLQF